VLLVQREVPHRVRIQSAGTIGDLLFACRALHPDPDGWHLAAASLQEAGVQGDVGRRVELLWQTLPAHPPR
jgi:hypothetical protein